MEYVRWEARMMAPFGDRSIYYDHASYGAERGNQRLRREMVAPTYHPDVEYLLDTLDSFEQAPRYGMNGLEPATWTDLQGWASMYSRWLHPIEIAALIRMQHVKLAAQHEVREARTPKKTEEP
jgi:hypothetical protein